MTGFVEAGAVLSLISGLITIIDATKTIYDGARDTKGQPDAFRQVAARLPLVEAVLQRAEAKTKTLRESEQDALKPLLASCTTKAEDLRRIFETVIRRDDDKWHSRYKKAFSAMKKGVRVELLMEGILKDIQVLACSELGTATDDEQKELDDAIKEMEEMDSSLQDDIDNLSLIHSGSGDNIATTGHGTTNLNKGSGSMYNNTFGDGTTANFGSKN
jgi:hypothetical protein